jgi:hypothetical protein
MKLPPGWYLSPSLLFAISLPASAQSNNYVYPQACGPKADKFVVEQVKGQPPTAPEPGKALVFFIQRQSGLNFTTRVGLDGAWTGVLLRDSYTFVSVAPGEHHACVASQNTKHPEVELLHFTAEAGDVYYFVVRGLAGIGDNTGPYNTMLFGPADRDEALHLIASDPQSVAKPEVTPR